MPNHPTLARYHNYFFLKILRRTLRCAVNNKLRMVNVTTTTTLCLVYYYVNVKGIDTRESQQCIHSVWLFSIKKLRRTDGVNNGNNAA